MASLSQSPFFNHLGEQRRSAMALPLAEALRPKTLDEVVGQTHVLGVGAPLRNLLAQGQLTSLIFWGPPGVGKTTLARLITENVNTSSTRPQFIALSAVDSGKKDLQAAVQGAKDHWASAGAPTVLFVDEIHRYNKTQQDALLPVVENGTITLMGATTENPSFQVIPALRSRLLVVKLEALTRDEIKTLLQRGVTYLNEAATQLNLSLNLDADALDFLATYANGDARSSLVLLELASKCAAIEDGQKQVTMTLLEQLAQEARLNYDRDGDAHYDHASAYQKSLRGGDADAALYWLAKMIVGGEDPRFIARSLLVCAAEDIGLARPTAMVLANSAYEAVDKLGWPEARIPLALATAYVAQAPKSNHAYKALDQALHDIQHGGKSYPVPLHLRDSHYPDAEKYGHGKDYVYTHNNPNAPQHFLPPELLGTNYLNWPTV